MATIILVAAIGGFALLFVATVALVYLNWSDKTAAPVLSILLVGTATALAAVWVTLKESSVESTFSTSIVIDTQDGAPVMLIPDPNSPKVSSRLSEFVRLGRPAINKDGNTLITIQKPSNPTERFTFCGELLQYRLLRAIEKLQTGSTKFGQVFGASIAKVSKPLKLSKTQDYPGEIFLDIIANNRFSKSDMERFHWEHTHVPLPPSTEVSLVHVPSTSAIGPEKFIVRLRKPLFFQIDFIVEPIGSTGVGILPTGLSLAPDVTSRCETYQFQVAEKATFEKITAGNSQTQEYKEWAGLLFSRLKEELAD